MVKRWRFEVRGTRGAWWVVGIFDGSRQHAEREARANFPAYIQLREWRLSEV